MIKFKTKGPLIWKIQNELGLNRDGDYGPKTKEAIAKRFNTNGEEYTNAMHQELFKKDITLFEQCLNLTGYMEGTMYDRCVGNFDGAGLTFGVIGFNIKSGTLQALCKMFMDQLDPDLDPKIYETLRDIYKLHPSKAKNMPQKVEESYKFVLQAISYYKWFVECQDQYARENYFRPAVKAYKYITNADNPIEIASTFDCSVQTGIPLGKQAQAFLKTKPANEYLKNLSEYIDNHLSSKWKEDVLSRRNVFINKKSQFRGSQLNISEYGFI